MEIIRYYVRPRNVLRGGWEIRKVMRMPDGSERDGGVHTEKTTRKEATTEKDKLNARIGGAR